jgi:multidrug resistance efflux pump
MSKILGMLVIVAAVGAWWFVGRPAEGPAPVVAEFAVERGTVRDVLREVGELVSQDPTLLQAPFSGELKWLVQDGTWVEAAEEVLVFNEEDLVKQVTGLRATVVDKQQLLQLAKLRAEHARIAEDQRLENASEELNLAAIRHRILTTPFTGGDRLVALDTEIRPIEAKLQELQDQLKPLEAQFRESRDAYVNALQDWQEGRGRLLEAKAKTNLKAVREKAGAQAEGEDAVSVDEEVAKLKVLLNEARTRHDADRAPYEPVLAQVDTIDAEAREVYIQIEIEKRGLPAVRLAIDRDIAKLQLEEAKRQAESAKEALDVGAMSQSRYDKLLAGQVAASGRLEILEFRLEIASRPPEEDVLAKSEAALAAAQRAVDNAKEIYEREMAIHKGEIHLIAAQLEKAKGELDRGGKGFSKAIEGSIKMLRTELALLTEEDAARREQILAEIATLDAEFAEAEQVPPNVLRAPSAGLVRLRYKDDEVTVVGDRWERGHTVAMLYPPGNMTVKAGINEVNFQRVRTGNRCRVTLPALDMHIEDATVKQISQIGRDRKQSESRWRSVPESGIIEFSLAVDLGREVDAFRQGMTVLLEIETERQEDVLHLPAAAVKTEEQGFSVLVDPATGTRRALEGTFFGDDVFIVTGGLSEGDRVFRSYGGRP